MRPIKTYKWHQLVTKIKSWTATKNIIKIKTDYDEIIIMLTVIKKTSLNIKQAGLIN